MNKSNTMLGLILLYWIGKYYYRLAEKYRKRKWLFAIIGIVAYYFGTIVIGGVLLVLLLEFVFHTTVEGFTDMQLGFMAIPFGIGFTYLIYFLLNKKWKSEEIPIKDEIEDIGKPMSF